MTRRLLWNRRPAQQASSSAERCPSTHSPRLAWIVNPGPYLPHQMGGRPISALRAGKMGLRGYPSSSPGFAAQAHRQAAKPRGSQPASRASFSLGPRSESLSQLVGWNHDSQSLRACLKIRRAALVVATQVTTTSIFQTRCHNPSSTRAMTSL